MSAAAKKAYTLDEAADATSISKRTLQLYIDRGDLIARYVGEKGSSPRILESDLDKFLANLPTRKTQPKEAA